MTSAVVLHMINSTDLKTFHCHFDIIWQIFIPCRKINKTDLKDEQWLTNIKEKNTLLSSHLRLNYTFEQFSVWLLVFVSLEATKNPTKVAS